MAVSLDGRIARHPHEADAERVVTGFSHPEDQKHLRRLIADSDAVVVGGRTLLAAGGVLETRVYGDRTGPRWYVAARGLHPSYANILQPQRAALTFVTPEACSSVPLPVECEVLTCPADVAWPIAVVQDITARGLRSVLLLGGAAVNRDFYRLGLVDELIITVLPIILGQKDAVPLVEPPLDGSVRLTLTSSQPVGDLVFLTYRVYKTSS